MSPAPVPSPESDGPTFQLGSLTAEWRTEIIALTNLNTPGAAFVNYDRFDLTALGADVDLDGQWDVRGFDLAEWRHIATTGRDQYVKVVLKGYLFPLGHPAVLVILTERILTPDPANPSSWSNAVLRNRQFIRVKQPVKTYPAPGQLYPNDWPFVKVELKTLVTPDLVHPLPIVGNATNNPNSQLVYVKDLSSNDVVWTWVGTDAAGNETHFTGPLCFLHGGTTGVPNPPVGSAQYQDEFTTANLMPLAGAYNAIADDATHTERRANTGGAHVKYAPEGPGKAGSTTHPTSSILLSAATPQTDPVTGTVMPSNYGPSGDALFADGQPAFYPALGAAQVRLPAAEGLSRGQLNDSSPKGGISIQYFGDFVKHGLVNPGSVYMALTDAVQNPSNAPVLKFPGDAVGGIGTPNVQVTGLSSAAGTVSGDLAHYASAGKQDPSAYFPGLTGPSSPQLLGGLLLSGILGEFKNAFSLPNIVNEIDMATGERTITYTMQATLQNWSPTPSVSDVFETIGANPVMNLTAVVTISPSGKSSFVVSGDTTPFNINLLGKGGGLSFIIIPFNRMSFTSKNGKKPDIKVDVGQVQFAGALEFVNDLEQFIEDIGGSGFSVKVRPTGITAGFGISLPSISIGMVDISGLGMSAAVDVPFLGGPATATFSFASKEKPFKVAVSMFGGSGYITLVLGMSGVQQVTASIEFGGNFELDIYVASGGISLMAGIYYQYTAANGMQLTGFVKMQGSLNVLGIISISIELDLSLTYQRDNSGNSFVSGTAELKASIHIIFFSIGIDVTIHKQFSGSGQAPQASPALRHRGAGAPAPGHRGAPAPGHRGAPAPGHRGAPVHGLSAMWQGPAASGFVTPPTFEDLMDSSAWQSYCGAFAG
jgi:hypothetical protein